MTVSRARLNNLTTLTNKKYLYLKRFQRKRNGKCIQKKRARQRNHARITFVYLSKHNHILYQPNVYYYYFVSIYCRHIILSVDDKLTWCKYLDTHKRGPYWELREMSTSDSLYQNVWTKRFLLFTPINLITKRPHAAAAAASSATVSTIW